MIPPLDAEEYERLVPAWAKELVSKPRNFVVGQRVYDVLYGTKYPGDNPYGTVTYVGPTGEVENGWATGVRVVHDNGCVAATIDRYYVAVPPEHDVPNPPQLVDGNLPKRPT